MDKITDSLCDTCKDNDICKDVKVRKLCGAYKPVCNCGEISPPPRRRLK